MDKLNSFGYVVNNDKNYDKTSYTFTTSIYKEVYPRIILSRKQVDMPCYGFYYESYGVIMPYAKDEIKLSTHLGTKLFDDEDLLVCFMEHINSIDKRDIPRFVNKFDEQKGKARVLRS